MSLSLKGREAALGYAWIFGILNADSQLASLAPGAVWRTLAPPGTPTPFVVMSHMSGTDTVTFGAVRSYGSHVYQVKAVGPATETAQTASAAQRIDQVLDGKIGVNIPGSDGFVMACFRTQAMTIDELVVGETWTNFLGMYRITMRPQ